MSESQPVVESQRGLGGRSSLTPAELALCDGTACRCFKGNAFGIYVQTPDGPTHYVDTSGGCCEASEIGYGDHGESTPSDAIAYLPTGHAAMLDLFRRHRKPSPLLAEVGRAKEPAKLKDRRPRPEPPPPVVAAVPVGDWVDEVFERARAAVAHLDRPRKMEVVADE